MNTKGPTTEDHERHMETMKRIGTTQGRREYVDGVMRSEGKFAAKWLTDDYAKWLDQQQQQRKRAQR